VKKKVKVRRPGPRFKGDGVFFNPEGEEDSEDILRLLVGNRRSGPCEDDYEATAPYVDMLPEESEHEEGSPLNFGKTYLTLD
jgi:hypothetical protein